MHIWQPNEWKIHVEAQIDFLQDIQLSEFEPILVEIEELAFNAFGINLVNIQPEFRKSDTKQLTVQD